MILQMVKMTGRELNTDVRYVFHLQPQAKTDIVG